MQAEETTYAFADVAKILGIAESKLRYWAQVGFVGPSARRGSKQVFTFQDLVSVKAAKELIERGIKAADVRRALDAVRSSLPHVERPLDRIRLAFDGTSLAVTDEGSTFEIDSGQKMFDFGLADLARQAEVTPMPRTPAARPVEERPRPDLVSAYDWFVEGLRCEKEGREDHAVGAYERCLVLDPGLAGAHTNLGRLAHRRGDQVGARAAFESALALDPDQPEARFNIANLILESGDHEWAVAEYRRVLQVAPDFGDAHYNLAVALERLGGRAQARAHLERFLGLAGPPAAGRSEEEVAWTDQARALIARLSE
jgi:tetratricopeptide (TPR) repeat protein